MEITLEKIELVKDRTGVSYKEAKEALEAAEGNVVDAIIKIEETVDINKSGKTNEFVGETMEKIKEFVKKGNISKIAVIKGEETIVNIPVNVGVVGAIVAPWGVIAAAIATVGFKCRVELTTTDGKVIDVTKRAEGFATEMKEKSAVVFDGMMEKGNDVVSNVKEKAPGVMSDVVEKSTDAYNTIKGAAVEKYSEFKAKKEENAADAEEEAGEEASEVKTAADNALEEAAELLEDICEKTCDALEEAAEATADAVEKAKEKTGGFWGLFSGKKNAEQAESADCESCEAESCEGCEKAQDETCDTEKGE